jgi:hypothetical protein
MDTPNTILSPGDINSQRQRLFIEIFELNVLADALSHLLLTGDNMQ